MQLKMIFPGYLCVKIDGPNCHKVLSMSSFRKIYLCDVTCNDCNICKEPSKKEKSTYKKKNHNIAQSDSPEKAQQSYILKIPWKQYHELQALCEKTASNITILSRHGWLYLQSRIYEHLSFMIGIIICLSLILFMQTRIWDIQVDGNIYYDSPVLIEYLATQKIIPGINKNKVSYIELADKIRQEFPKIKWTSVELDGCNLVVHLKENLHLGMEAGLENDEGNESEKENTIDHKTSDSMNEKNVLSINNTESIDLVSDKEGVVKSIYVRSGIANVKAGDTCKKGDILVKGQIPIYNDAQEIVRYDYVEADADITIQHDYHYYDEIERSIEEKKIIKTNQSYSFQVFDCYFSFISNEFTEDHSNQDVVDNSKNNSNLSNVNMLAEQNNDSEYQNESKYNSSKEYLKNTTQLKLTQSLILPIYFSTTTIYEYEIIPKTLTEKETKDLLEEEIFYFCDDLEKKGVQIYQNNVKMYISEVKGVATGKVTVFESIGVKKAYIPKSDISIDSYD